MNPRVIKFRGLRKDNGEEGSEETQADEEDSKEASGQTVNKSNWRKQ